MKPLSLLSGHYFISVNFKPIHVKDDKRLTTRAVFFIALGKTSFVTGQGAEEPRDPRKAGKSIHPVCSKTRVLPNPCIRI